MKKFLNQWGGKLLWSVTILSALLAVIAWGSQLEWQLSGLSTYQLFPLLGLIAYSLMIMHYPSGLLRRLAPAAMNFKQYYWLTSRIVLLLILLHPGMLILQRWVDGYGLPPGSYLSYVAGSMKIAVIFGVISLTIFLFFELKEHLQHKPWWRLVEHLNNAAMVLIWIHGFQLGSHIYGWYRGVWYLYGAVLLVLLFYFYLNPSKKSNQAT